MRRKTHEAASESRVKTGWGAPVCPEKLSQVKYVQHVGICVDEFCVLRCVVRYVFTADKVVFTPSDRYVMSVIQITSKHAPHEPKATVLQPPWLHIAGK